jgi:hypothetical protein
LACWCALDGKPCHADVLLWIASGVPLPAWANSPLDIGRVRLGMMVADVEAMKRKGKKRRLEMEEADAAR